MDKNSAVLFNYAKASGLLSKSFLKNKVALLFSQKSLSDLWTLLFKTPVPMVPEVLLAGEIEKEAFSRFITSYEYFLKQFDNPPAILINHFRRYEVENLKEICDALCSGEKQMPELIDLHGYSVLHVEKWPDIKEITKDTVYSWIDHVPEKFEQQHIEFKLDLQLIQEGWKAVQNCKGDDKTAQKKLFLDEFKIKNVVWALRLWLFYGMKKEDVINNLFYAETGPIKSDPLAGPAIKILDFDPEKYSDWEKWEYKAHLNPKIDGEPWKINPSWIEKSVMSAREKRALQIFHQYSQEAAALTAWFNIKAYELSCIRTAVESIRLNIDSAEAMSILGIKE